MLQVFWVVQASMAHLRKGAGVSCSSLETLSDTITLVLGIKALEVGPSGLKFFFQ